MQFKQRQEAQKIILRRCGAIVQQENGRSVLGADFMSQAARFADLKKKGLNYLQIEKELSK